MFGARHPPAQRFNAGQKMIKLDRRPSGGGRRATDRLSAEFPFYLTDIAGMQLAPNESTAPVRQCCSSLQCWLTSYIGTIGMKATSCDVDRHGPTSTGPKQHHSGLGLRRRAPKRRPRPQGHVAPAE